MDTSRLSAIWSYRRVLVTLVRRDLRIRYARSWLGYAWTLIDPLSIGLVYWFVFGGLMGGGRHTPGIPFMVYLLAGMLPWNWFNGSLNETARALYAERLLVRSTNIPRELWVARVVIAKGIEFVLSLPIILVFALYYLLIGQGHYDWRIVFILPALVLQFVLVLGMGLVMAPVTALVDDFIRVVRIALRLLFYITPIVYSLSLVESKFSWAPHVMVWNPLVGITDMYRVGFTYGATVGPMWHAWAIATIVSFAWLFFGMWVFRKLEPAVLKEI